MSKEEVGGISKERIKRLESSKIERGEKGRKKTKNDKESITCDDEVLGDDEEGQPKNHKRRFVCRWSVCVVLWRWRLKVEEEVGREIRTKNGRYSASNVVVALVMMLTAGGLYQETLQAKQHSQW
jgi:hypothetical protein